MLLKVLHDAKGVLGIFFTLFDKLLVVGRNAVLARLTNCNDIMLYF